MKDQAKKRGIALALALLVLAVLAVLGGAIASLGMSTHAQSRTAQRNTTLLHMANGGLQELINEIYSNAAYGTAGNSDGMTVDNGGGSNAYTTNFPDAQYWWTFDENGTEFFCKNNLGNSSSVTVTQPDGTQMVVPPDTCLAIVSANQNGNNAGVLGGADAAATVRVAAIVNNRWEYAIAADEQIDIGNTTITDGGIQSGVRSNLGTGDSIVGGGSSEIGSGVDVYLVDQATADNQIDTSAATVHTNEPVVQIPDIHITTDYSDGSPGEVEKGSLLQGVQVIWNPDSNYELALAHARPLLASRMGPPSSTSSSGGSTTTSSSTTSGSTTSSTTSGSTTSGSTTSSTTSGSTTSGSTTSSTTSGSTTSGSTTSGSTTSGSTTSGGSTTTSGSGNGNGNSSNGNGNSSNSTSSTSGGSTTTSSSSSSNGNGNSSNGNGSSGGSQFTLNGNVITVSGQGPHNFYSAGDVTIGGTMPPNVRIFCMGTASLDNGFTYSDTTASYVFCNALDYNGGGSMNLGGNLNVFAETYVRINGTTSNFQGLFYVRDGSQAPQTPPNPGFLSNGAIDGTGSIVIKNGGIEIGGGGSNTFEANGAYFMNAISAFNLNDKIHIPFTIHSWWVLQ